MFAFVLMFALQWLPGLPLYAAGILGFQAAWSDFITVFCAHIGGPINLIIYANQEGLLHLSRKNDTSWTDSEPQISNDDARVKGPDSCDVPEPTIADEYALTQFSSQSYFQQQPPPTYSMPSGKANKYGKIDSV